MPSTWPGRTLGAKLPLTGGRWSSRDDVDAVIVATTNDGLAPVTLAAVERGQARPRREARRPPRGRAGAGGRRRRGGRRHREGRLQPPLPPRRAEGQGARRRGRRRPAAVRPRAVRPRGPAGLRAGVAGRPGPGRRRRAARPGSPPDRPGPLVRRGFRRGRRVGWRPISGTCRSRTTPSSSSGRPPDRSPGSMRAARSGRTCSRSRSSAGAASSSVDGLGGSYGVERLTLYQMRPEMGPPETTTWEYPGEDLSWRAEWRHFLDAVAAIDGAVGLAGRDALAVLRLVDRVYAHGDARGRDHHPEPAPDLAGRRGHRPALVLPATRWLPGRRGHRQVRLHHPAPDVRPDELIVKYSKLERVTAAADVQHPIIREALRLVGIDGPSLEMTSMADIPAGTGLGSSGSFTTALLKALHTYQKNLVAARASWPSRRATSRSTASASPSASRTSTSRRTAAHLLRVPPGRTGWRRGR